jgi:hypothetical protein
LRLPTFVACARVCNRSCRFANERSGEDR